MYTFQTLTQPLAPNPAWAEKLPCFSMYFHSQEVEQVSWPKWWLLWRSISATKQNVNHLLPDMRCKFQQENFPYVILLSALEQHFDVDLKIQENNVGDTKLWLNYDTLGWTPTLSFIFIRIFYTIKRLKIGLKLKKTNLPRIILRVRRKAFKSV